jgi:hypothetical protein
VNVVANLMRLRVAGGGAMLKIAVPGWNMVIVSLALAAAISFPAIVEATPADDLVEGKLAFERGEKSKSFQSAVKAARANYVPAYAVAGSHYALGIGTPKDAVKAVFWFQKSASAGDAFGQYQLAVSYLNGDGISEDLGSALRWAKLSANANHPGAAGLADHIREKLGPNASACVGYGFELSTVAFSQCVMQLDQAKQEAQIAQQQYEIQVAQHQQQVASYQAQQDAIKRERDRRKWEMLARLGAGMASSTSPSFLGAVNEGLAAANGAPLAQPVAPPPPPPRTHTMVLPNGSMITCTTTGSVTNCF